VSEEGSQLPVLDPDFAVLPRSNR